jgi:hypothetical protein
MKNFSLPRLAIVLWFLNYALFALMHYVVGGGRPEIFSLVLSASCMAIVELVCLGLIEDKF